MHVARALHSMTILKDGRVLVAGGATGSFDQVLSSAEIFDPDAGTWTTVGPMAHARMEHCGTLLPSGRVLVAGGEELPFRPVFEAEVYDPGSGTWAPTENDPPVGGKTVASLLPSGKVLIVGGTGLDAGISAMAMLYDPATNRFEPTGSLREPRQMPALARLPSGELLAVGGTNAIGSFSAERYDPGSGAWRAAADSPFPSCRTSAELLPGGRVLVAGGYLGDCFNAGGDTTLYSAQSAVYDPASDTWKATPSMAVPRFKAAYVPLPSGQVLAFGGCKPGRVGRVVEAFAFGSASWDAAGNAWDGAGGGWTTAGSFTAAEGCAARAALLDDGRILVTGGENPTHSSVTSGVDLYQP
jgi:hypothetical protein